MATIRVSNQNQLEAALNDVRGGDTILLESGTYNLLEMKSTLRNDFDFSQKVTIASANESNPAVLRAMNLRDVHNVEIRNIGFKHDGDNDTKPFFVEQSSDLTFDELNFTGSARNGYGQGAGLNIKESNDIAVTDSEFRMFEYGMKIYNSSDLNVSRNSFREISLDGAQFGGLERMLLANNSFTNFHSNPNALHKDAVQFIATDSQPVSKHIDIIGNYIDNPENAHGLYFGNSLYKDRGMMNAFYEDIFISSNTIEIGNKMGINVMHGNGVVIDNNVLRLNGAENNSKSDIPLINVSTYSWNVTIRSNDVASVPDRANSSWVVSNNDTDSSARVEHWDMVYGNSRNPGSPREPDAWSSGGGSVNPPSPPDEPDPEPNPDSGSNGDDVGRWDGDTLRINGVVIDGDTRIRFSNFDIPGGDELVLAGFGDGTFRSSQDSNQLPVWRNGASTWIDNMVDFHELDTASSRVSTSTRNGDLVLQIDSHRGMGELVFDGLAAAFRASDSLDL